MSQHLVRDLEKLKRNVLALSAMVEEGVRDALDSFRSRDLAMAQRVIAADEEIDCREIEVEEECLKILALHQPVAIDLRFIVSVLKINNDLERIADLGVNIAELTVMAEADDARPRPPDMEADIDDMATRSRSMLKRSLDALVNLDSSLAREVIADDDAVDAIHGRMYEHMSAKVAANPENVRVLMRLLLLSRHLERIADLATNIAEDVTYMTEGRIVRHGAGQDGPTDRPCD